MDFDETFSVHNRVLYISGVIAYMYVSFFIQYGITFVLQLQFVMGALSIQISIQAMNDSFEQISENLYFKGLLLLYP